MTAASPPSFADVPVVLLDLDGTIVDSGQGILDALAHAFAECGEPLPSAEVLRSFIGPPLADSFRLTLGLTEERSDALRRAFSVRYRAHGVLEASPYPGMLELVQDLAAEGRIVAVATNKSEPTALRLLAHQGLEDHFALIGGADRAHGRHDKADVIGSVLDRLGLAAGRPGARSCATDAMARVADPGTAAGTAEPGLGALAAEPRDRALAPEALAAEPARSGPVAPALFEPVPPAVMVGDRLHDAEGAARHGLPTILVGWGYGGRAEQESGLPLARSVEELATMLRA